MVTTIQQQSPRVDALPTLADRQLIATYLFDRAAWLLLVADGRLAADGHAVTETPARLRATAARLQALAVGLTDPCGPA